MLNKMLKRIPRFGRPAEARRFWEGHASTDYVGKAKRVSLPDLRMSRTAPGPLQGLFDRSEVAASERDAPYQSLVKVGLAERGDAQ
jgi:hypothetical protein